MPAFRARFNVTKEYGGFYNLISKIASIQMQEGTGVLIIKALDLVVGRMKICGLKSISSLLVGVVAKC